MNRYQIYLDPQNVASLDQMAIDLNFSRSEIIRDVLDRIVLEYKKFLAVSSQWRLRNNPILKMSGIGKSSTGNIAEDVDSIYLRD